MDGEGWNGKEGGIMIRAVCDSSYLDGHTVSISLSRS